MHIKKKQKDLQRVRFSKAKLRAKLFCLPIACLRSFYMDMVLEAAIIASQKKIKPIESKSTTMTESTAYDSFQYANRSPPLESIELCREVFQSDQDNTSCSLKL